MSLFTPKSQLDSDLAEKDASILRGAEALHHAAAVLANENARFWSVPTERLLAVLNHDVATTLATFAANTAAATAINAVLDQLADPRFPARAYRTWAQRHRLSGRRFCFHAAARTRNYTDR